MLIARVKATQEREIPELADRLAAVEAFQSAGEEVCGVLGVDVLRGSPARTFLAPRLSEGVGFVRT